MLLSTVELNASLKSTYDFALEVGRRAIKDVAWLDVVVDHADSAVGDSQLYIDETT